MDGGILLRLVTLEWMLMRGSGAGDTHGAADRIGVWLIDLGWVLMRERNRPCGVQHLCWCRIQTAVPANTHTHTSYCDSLGRDTCRGLWAVRFSEQLCHVFPIAVTSPCAKGVIWWNRILCKSDVPCRHTLTTYSKIKTKQ